MVLFFFFTQKLHIFKMHNVRCWHARASWNDDYNHANEYSHLHMWSLAGQQAMTAAESHSHRKFATTPPPQVLHANLVCSPMERRPFILHHCNYACFGQHLPIPPPWPGGHSPMSPCTLYFPQVTGFVFASSLLQFGQSPKVIPVFLQTTELPFLRLKELYCV